MACRQIGQIHNLSIQKFDFAFSKNSAVSEANDTKRYDMIGNFEMKLAKERNCVPVFF